MANPDAAVAREVQERLTEYLEEQTESAGLAALVSRAEPELHTGALHLTFTRPADFREASRHRTLIVESLAVVCEYLVPLRLAVDVKRKR